MKVSLNLAQEFSNVDLKSIPHDELVTKIGAQLGAVEEVVDYAPRYKNIVVVKVVECKKHPNADKLSLCRVDDGGVTANVERGDDGLVQVVCGAPNVKAGMFAVWIPPEATVPSTLDKESFVLEARELRGKVSNGMLASPKELAISEEHDGILELTEQDAGREPKIGESITHYFGLDDFVIDCENKMFTHRPDCFGNLGVARELAGISGLKFESPKWYLNLPIFESPDKLPMKVENNATELSSRFTVVTMDGIKIKSSPTWMTNLLKRVGIKSINNVVDITNYVMHLTGQPMHAFDYDKLQKYSDEPSIQVRNALENEEITLLGNKKIVMNSSDLVLATDKTSVDIAGIMGGANTEVDDSTKRIVLTCTNFDMYAIRRSSMRHGLFTDAVTRNNKGISPLQNDRIIAYAMKLMTEHAGAEQASRVYDLSSFDIHSDNLNHVETTIEFINQRLGTSLMPEEVKNLLENVEFSVALQGETLLITAPFWRMDIAIGEDIVEEVGRLYGYQNVPTILPARTSKPANRNKGRDFTRHIRYTLRKAGANEVLTYSFVHGDLLKNTGTDPEKWAYHVRNALSPDLQYYRTSLAPSLLAKIHSNLKAGAGRGDNEFALFEVGKVHVKGEMEHDEPTLPKQMKRIAFVYAADDKTAKKYHGSPYYQAKKYLDSITHGQATYSPLDTNEYPVVSAYEQSRSAVVTVNEQILGVIGEYTSNAKKHLKLPAFCAGFELDVDLLKQHLNQETYSPLSTYPDTLQDITFEVESDVSWGHLEQLLHAELAVAKAESGYDYTIEPLDIFKKEDDNRRISYRIQLTHHNKTMKTEEVNSLLDQIAKAAHENLHAKRI